MSEWSVTLKSVPVFRIGSGTLHSHSYSHKSSLSFGGSRIASSQRVYSVPQGRSNLIDDPRMWRRPIRSTQDEEDENDEDRTLDLLVSFLHNVFNKLSKRARKALRSVLPLPVSASLVAFSVNGVLVLAFLWILKAFLEVVCTLGSVVFVSILLIRGLWSGVSFIQESRNQKVDQHDIEHRAWNGAQPVT